MITGSQLRETNREMAEVAAREGKRPFEVYASDWTDYIQSIDSGGRPPTLQWVHLAPDYVEELYPGEYEVIETLFVDKTCFDLYDAGGPALSIYGLVRRGQALSQVNGNMFATIHDEGQFQIYITLYRRIGSRQCQEEFPWAI